MVNLYYFAGEMSIIITSTVTFSNEVEPFMIRSSEFLWPLPGPINGNIRFWPGYYPGTRSFSLSGRIFAARSRKITLHLRIAALMLQLPTLKPNLAASAPRLCTGWALPLYRARYLTVLSDKRRTGAPPRRPCHGRSAGLPAHPSFSSSGWYKKSLRTYYGIK